VASVGVLSPSRAQRWLVPFAAGFFILPVVVAYLLPAAPWAPLVVSVVLALVGFAIWPARTLALIAVFVLFTDTIELWTGDRIKLFDEIVIPVIALMTLVTRRHVIRARIHPVRETAVVILLVAAIGSSVLNAVPFTTMLPGLLLLGKGLAVFYVALVLDVRREDIDWIARFVLAVGLLVLAVGALELVMPSALQAIGLTSSEARAGLPALKSLFYHPQLFGWFCAFIALYLFAHHVVLKRPLFLVFGLLFSIATILSARRKSIFGLAAGLAVGVAVEASHGRAGLGARLRRWVPSAIGVAAIAIAFLPAFATLYQLTIDRYVVPGIVVPGTPGAPSDVAEPDDTPARVALIVGSIEIARDHLPLGGGLGRYGSWISREQYSDLYYQYGLSRIYGLSPQNPQFVTDTFWPQILGETGVLGMAGYVVFLVVVGIQLWRLARRTDLPPGVTALALGTAMVFAQTLVESIASPILSSPSQTYLVMMAIGGMLGFTMLSPRQPVSDPVVSTSVEPGASEAVNPARPAPVGTEPIGSSPTAHVPPG
jgi:hypothetical protein